MCGRFTLRTPLSVLAEQFLFDLGEVPTDFGLVPRYNIAPTQTIVAVRQPAEGAPRQLALLHWGLIPSWAKDAKLASSMINARSETLAEKPAFRTAFARRRCLILADGYYEWQAVGKKKLPLLFHRRDGRPFAFAGLWERWRGPAGLDGDAPPLESCTIVTTAASELSAHVHDRMPAILDPVDYDLWLDPAVQDKSRLLGLLRPYTGDELVAEPVSTRVNSVKNDDPGCIEIVRELF
jgi:putative SOS response-associated peptidase YedK